MLKSSPPETLLTISVSPVSLGVGPGQLNPSAQTAQTRNNFMFQPH